MKSFLLSAIVLAFCSSTMAKDESLADLIKMHLVSIGSDQARAAIKTRVVQGTLKFKLLNQAGLVDGKVVLVSEDNKSAALLKLPNSGYHGERFICDGRRIQVAQVKPGDWSTLGAFVIAHPEIVTEGLFGGSLSTGWALQRLEQNRPKLRDSGLKKIDGRELRRIEYLPAKHSELEIFVYLDPQTGRHVMTSYSLSIAPTMGTTDLATSKQDYTRYYLEERFDDFKDTEGLQLPRHWVVQFTSEVPIDPNHPRFARSNTSVSQFDATANEISQNVAVDPGNFVVK